MGKGGRERWGLGCSDKFCGGGELEVQVAYDYTKEGEVMAQVVTKLEPASSRGVEGEAGEEVM